MARYVLSFGGNRQEIDEESAFTRAEARACPPELRRLAGW
jgi:hypothetical protein